jgi:hypothetical protein
MYVFVGLICGWVVRPRHNLQSGKTRRTKEDTEALDEVIGTCQLCVKLFALSRMSSRD